MKPTFLRLLPFVAIVAPRLLLAGEKTVAITPQSIGAWTVVGEAPQANATTLVLPAGAQLAKKFDASKLAVQLSSRIRFGRVSEEAPVLEIGNVALVFVQVDGTGALMLVPDQADPIVLPTKVELDADGYGEVKSISFSRSGKMLSVAVGEAHNDYEIAAPENALWEMVVTSGDVAWKFDQLDVSVATADQAAEGASGQTDGSSDGKDNGSEIPAKATKPAASPVIIGVDGLTSGAKTKKTQNGDTSVGNATLEVFSPPSIRHGNVDAARNAALGLATKR